MDSNENDFLRKSFRIMPRCGRGITPQKTSVFVVQYRQEAAKKNSGSSRKSKQIFFTKYRTPSMITFPLLKFRSKKKRTNTDGGGSGGGAALPGGARAPRRRRTSPPAPPRSLGRRMGAPAACSPGGIIAGSRFWLLPMASFSMHFGMVHQFEFEPETRETRMHFSPETDDSVLGEGSMGVTAFGTHKRQEGCEPYAATPLE